MARPLRFSAPTSRGTEPVLAAELRSLGIHRVKEGHGVVELHGSLSEGYRALLWSRVASRVLLQLSRFEARDADELYAGVKAIDWARHLDVRSTLSVDFVGRSEQIRHSGFGALRTKDAIVDCLRAVTGQRPDVDPKDADLRVHVHLAHAVATVSIDLAGRPLHERGEPGRHTGEAPLKESLAAALLLMADWPRQARRGAPLLDPMCGSGTFLIEAAGMALDRAANLDRRRWGFQGWQGHDPDLWDRIRKDALARWQEGRRRSVGIAGMDTDAGVLEAAGLNAETQGLSEVIRLRRGRVEEMQPPRLPRAEAAPRGLVVTNPPYGVRLGDEEALMPLYAALGDALRRRFLGWTAHVLTASPLLAGAIGLKPSRRIPVWNGRLECRFLEIPISERPPEKAGPAWRDS